MLAAQNDRIPGDHAHKSRVSPRLTYAIAGVFLGLGAPAGALLIRMAYLDVGMMSELRANAFFYLYSLIGTSVVFAVGGAVAGSRLQRLRGMEAFYHELSQMDPLTGLLNSRAFREQYDRVRERAARFVVPVAVLLIDVDELKRINDEHGHEAGNLVLRRVADAIRQSKRTSDLGSRWGGDEFAIAMEGADAGAARRVAESVLSRLRGDKSILTATVTIGVAGGVPTAANDFFGAADAALYEGKRAGRNCVQMAAAEW